MTLRLGAQSDSNQDIQLFHRCKHTIIAPNLHMQTYIQNIHAFKHWQEYTSETYFNVTCMPGQKLCSCIAGSVSKICISSPNCSVSLASSLRRAPMLRWFSCLEAFAISIFGQMALFGPLVGAGCSALFEPHASQNPSDVVLPLLRIPDVASVHRERHLGGVHASPWRHLSRGM